MAKADLARAKALYPSTTQMGFEEWVSFFDTPEGFKALGRILYDIYDEVLTQAERDRGVRQMGRRPVREGVSLEDVFDVVFPQPFTNDPFVESLPKLLAGRSQRAFCQRVPCNQATLSRLMTGRLTPDRLMLERIAEAARVSPSYFVEWRALYLGDMITSVMLQRPNVSVGSLQRLQKMRDERTLTEKAPA